MKTPKITGRDSRTGAFVAAGKTRSGREKWRVDGKVHVTSSSTASVMDETVEKYRTALRRLARMFAAAELTAAERMSLLAGIPADRTGAAEPAVVPA